MKFTGSHDFINGVFDGWDLAFKVVYLIPGEVLEWIHAFHHSELLLQWYMINNFQKRSYSGYLIQLIEDII